MITRKGVKVYCTVCGKQKKPRGRSAPAEMELYLCNYECPGYTQDPDPGELWPGEVRTVLDKRGDHGDEATGT